MRERICERCGGPFLESTFDAWRGRRFCSETCRKREEARKYRLRKFNR